MAATDLQHYERIQEMLMSEGWKEVVEELQGMRELIGAIDHIKDAKDLHFRQGQLQVIGSLLALPDTTSDALDALNEEVSA